MTQKAKKILVIATAILWVPIYLSCKIIYIAMGSPFDKNGES